MVESVCRLDNLLFQIRVKLLAAKAGVQSIMTFEGQISIRMEGLDQIDRMALQRFLGNHTRVSKQAVWLRRDGRSELPWQVSVVQTLELLADWSR